MRKAIFIVMVVVLTVVGVYVSGVESQPTGWLHILANDSAAAVQFRAVSTYGAPVTIGHGTAAPTAANTGSPPMDGELFVTRAAATDPILSFYSQNSTAWAVIPNETDAAAPAGAWTFSGVSTFTGTSSFTGDVTITGDLNIDGPITTTVYRDEFSRPCMIKEEDFTAEVGTDAAMMIVQCQDGIAPWYHFRIDGAQATPWVGEVTAGNAAGGPYMVDMDNDAATGEGIAVVFVDDPQVAKRGGLIFGQTARFRIGIFVVNISDAAVLHAGFKLNEDYVDDNTLATHDSYVMWSSPAGTTSATSGLNGADDTEVEATCDMDDNVEMIFEIQISATGIGTFLCGLTEATLAEVATPTVLAGFEAGDIFEPTVQFLIGAAADAEYHITFVELEYTDE